ncbi:hypothetical protein PIB30_054387 [Stylosanthes scabra]|uniref:Uncharacterized protein n=1 Tax=Stylosanthes scabra TaxID=79078 RepID=A0ABU6UIL9_9FABA|nr:hypothetical protein [Stylosanthes scabra]
MIDVFAKEVGAEAYSMESHPNREVGGSTCSESLKSVSMDPLINAIITGELGFVHGVMEERGFIGGSGGVSKFDCLNLKGVTDSCYVKGVRVELMELDPVIIEAQINANGSQKEKRSSVGQQEQVCDNDVKRNGLYDGATTSGSGSSNSCPYPPGFGPCTGQTHHHCENVWTKTPNLFDGRVSLGEGEESVKESASREPAAVQESVAAVRNPREDAVQEPAAEGEENEAAHQGLQTRARSVQSNSMDDDIASEDEVERSSETLYYVNRDYEELQNQLSSGVLVTGLEGACAATGSDDEERSDETLYRINEEAFCKLELGIREGPGLKPNLRSDYSLWKMNVNN